MSLFHSIILFMFVSTRVFLYEMYKYPIVKIEYWMSQ